MNLAHAYLYFEAVVRDLILSADEFQVVPCRRYEAFPDMVPAGGYESE
jgi:hypothetical protein